MGHTVLLKASSLRNDEGQNARIYFTEDKFREKTLPKDADENAKAAFRRNFLIPKGAPAMDAILEAVEAAATEKFGKAVAEKWMEKNIGEGAAINDHCAIRDGDERDEVGEDFAGHFFINAKTYRRDLVMSAKGVEIGDALDEDAEGDELEDDDVAPYSGCHIKALKLEVWAYQHGKKNGISVNVLGWRVKDDEAAVMESTGGESASKDELGDDDEDDAATTSKAKPKGKAKPSRK